MGPEVYARWRESGIDATTERVEGRLILELIGNVSGCRVLDIGCGDGEFALELTKRGALVTGIDSSPAMIDAARRLAAQHNADITFRVAMAEHLPFPRTFLSANGLRRSPLAGAARWRTEAEDRAKPGPAARRRVRWPMLGQVRFPAARRRARLLRRSGWDLLNDYLSAMPGIDFSPQFVRYAFST